MSNQPKVRCQISGQEVPHSSAIPVDLVRESLIPTLKSMTTSWDDSGFVSLDALNQARMAHVQEMLLKDEGETRDLKEAVFTSLRDNEILSEHTDLEFEKSLSFADKLSDKIASFGGSWTFIISFGFVISAWIGLNVVMSKGAFDPYPFILLNLVLSTLAAIQAPVIMMSQNRQESRDRMRGINDYKVNLKAELEIRHLNEKLDKLMQDQWQHLLEIQQMQLEMIRETGRSGNASK